MKRFLCVLVLVFALQATVSAATAVTMSPDEKKALDTFFSYIAEANLESFASGGLTDDMLLYFAQWHLILNTPGDVKTVNEGNDVQVPKERIDGITKEFFGRAMTRHEESVYTFGLGAGEVYVFAQADALNRRGDGLLEVKGTIYYVPYDTKLDPHAAPGDWKKQGIKVRIYGAFSGLVQQNDPAGNGRYTLVEYTKTDKE